MINRESIKEAYEWFCEYVEQVDGKPFESFSEGTINYEEGYKTRVYDKANEALSLKEWKSTDIGNGNIARCVIKAMYKSDNIVNYRSRSAFIEKTESHIKQAESILYDLFKKKNSKDAFERACKLWGRRYNDLSYLMFLKDKDKYLPARGSIHKKKFEVLGLPTKLFDKCTWENYLEYCEIMEEVRVYLEELFEMPVSLLDAHSFVWKVGGVDGNYAEKIREIREAKKDADINRQLATEKPKASEDVKLTKCKAKEPSKAKSENKTPVYRRSIREAREALKRADYKCEYDERHESFIKKSDGHRYTETHHLIPMEYQKEFEYSLDNWPNIISLCSNCHNQIHYGEGAEKLIEKLYNDRKNLLKEAKIDISLDRLLEMYNLTK